MFSLSLSFGWQALLWLSTALCCSAADSAYSPRLRRSEQSPFFQSNGAGA